jgi:N-acetylglucosamine-6-phosphate deacetylase
VIFRNGRLIFPEGIRDGLELVVRDGKIAEVHAQRDCVADEAIIDLEKNFLAPGFIDLHLHGAVGRDMMEATLEAFRAICDYHASGGTTSLLLTTVTAPIPEILRVLEAVRDCSRPALLATPERSEGGSGRSDNARRQSAVATDDTLTRILGVHVEGPFISKTKPGAQRQEFIIEPSAEVTNELLRFSDVIKVFTIAPEIAGAFDLIDRLREKNVRVSGGHSDASDDDARAAFAHGMRQVTHTFNCMSSARRRGIYREAGLLEFALSEPEVFCELIADGHHVLPTLMQMLYRAKGASGICLVTDATAGAGLPNESHFSLGARECVVRDGVCLLADGSALAGSASRMIDLVRTMVRKVNVPLPEAIAMATLTPARAIGLEKTKGTFALGSDADFVVLSPELEVVQTFSRGVRIFRHQGAAISESPN